jgi:rSAM/selenodomain-associated transferase 1
VEKPVDKVDNRSFPAGHSLQGPVLGVFAKQPVTGQVKTRFSPSLQPAQARNLYRAALEETIARFAAGPAALVLGYAGRRAWFAREFPGVPLFAQGGGDLSARLARATAVWFAAGAGPVAVAGADSPDLPLSLIEAAFAALSSADVAAVACRDGGYALLALRRPAPDLFAGIPWSTAEVLAATHRRCADLGLRFAVVGTWDDLDDLAALHRLMVRSPDCRTARYARTHLHTLLSSGGG